MTDVPDLDALNAVTQGKAASEAMAFDSVEPEFLVLTMGSAG